MTAQPRAPRGIGRTWNWCFLCGAAHAVADCPLTPDEQRAAGQERLAREPATQRRKLPRTTSAWRVTQ